MNIAELFVRLSADPSGVVTGTRQASRALTGFANTTTSVNSSMNKLQGGFVALAQQATGTNPAIARLGSVLAEMAVGGPVVVGVLAGLTAVVFAYRKLSENAREAREENQKLIDGLVDGAKKAVAASLPALRARQALLQAQLDEAVAARKKGDILRSAGREERQALVEQLSAALAQAKNETEKAEEAFAKMMSTTQGIDGITVSVDRLTDSVGGLVEAVGKLPSFADIMGGAARGDAEVVDRFVDEFMARAKQRFGTDEAFGGPGRGGTGIGPQSGAGTEIRRADSPLGDLLGGLKDFGQAMGGILAALSPWKLLLDAVGRALGDFLVNVTPIVEILAAALMPILKALFPVFKLLAVAATYVGQVFFTIAGGILKAVGYLVKGLGALIEKLPGVGDFGLKKAGQAMIDLGKGFFEASSELGDARDEIRKLEWKDALDPLTDAANETAEALRNVPSLFNANLARFRATGGGGLTAPTSLGNPITPITFNGDVTVVANDPEEFVNKLRQRARRGGALGIAPAY